MPSPLQKLGYFIVSSREIFLRTNNDFFSNLINYEDLSYRHNYHHHNRFFASNLNSKNTAYDALKENKTVEILISFFNSFFQLDNRCLSICLQMTDGMCII